MSHALPASAPVGLPQQSFPLLIERSRDGKSPSGKLSVYPILGCFFHHPPVRPDPGSITRDRRERSDGYGRRRHGRDRCGRRDGRNDWRNDWRNHGRNDRRTHSGHFVRHKQLTKCFLAYSPVRDISPGKSSFSLQLGERACCVDDPIDIVHGGKPPIRVLYGSCKVSDLLSYSLFPEVLRILPLRR